MAFASPLAVLYIASAAALWASILPKIAVEAAEWPQRFVPRPTQIPRHGLPSSGAYRRANGGRRLEAEDGPKARNKPERDLYVAEEDGHRFDYEYASSCNAERILDVDPPLA